MNTDFRKSHDEYRFAPAEPSRQIIEAASWRLVAEIVRRYPDRFTVIETHPGGGTYDCLTLLDQDKASGLHRIEFNSVGSVVVWPRDSPSGESVWKGCWSEMVATSDPRELLDRLSEHAADAGDTPPPGGPSRRGLPGHLRVHGTCNVRAGALGMPQRLPG